MSPLCTCDDDDDAHARARTRTSSPQDRVRHEIDAILARLHVLVLGPGLGRETYMQHYARTALALARSRAMFVVLDADALWMVGQDVSLVRGYHRGVLTPNVVEFRRLCEQVGVGGDVGEGERAVEVSKRLEGVVVLEKGARDVIASDTTGERVVVVVDVQGGMKRCGGQGDVLGGCVGAMLAWAKCYEEGAFGCVYFLKRFRRVSDER